MNNKVYIPLPDFARQIWTDEKNFKWWVKYYIDHNHPGLRPIDVKGNKIICLKEGLDGTTTPSSS
nr:hypothetical protein 18 [Bacillales bacterium]